MEQLLTIACRKNSYSSLDLSNAFVLIVSATVTGPASMDVSETVQRLTCITREASPL